MIYFDNAATTHFKPQCVIDAVTECLSQLSFNPNRSGSKGAMLLSQRIFLARKAVSALLNNDSETNIVFTQNCTAALNLAILGTVKRGGHVVTTVTEHNSVLRPLMQLKSRGFIDVSFVRPDKDGSISPETVLDALRPNTYAVAICHASNVMGHCQDLEKICGRVKAVRPDIMTLVDGAQSVGYVPVDMTRWKVDMMTFSAHKGLHAMQGAGVLATNKDFKPRPVVFGGTGTESQNLLQPATIPDGLEAGTLNCPAILALSAAIGFWAKNFLLHAQQIVRLQKLLLTGLKQIPNVNVYSQPNASGIVAFNIASLDSTQIADLLNEKDIAVRAGLHCAPLMHKWLNTIETGAVRASVAFDNTAEECYMFLNTVEKIAKSF